MATFQVEHKFEIDQKVVCRWQKGDKTYQINTVLKIMVDRKVNGYGVTVNSVLYELSLSNAAQPEDKLQSLDEFYKEQSEA